MKTLRSVITAPFYLLGAVALALLAWALSPTAFCKPIEGRDPEDEITRPRQP